MHVKRILLRKIDLSREKSAKAKKEGWDMGVPAFGTHRSGVRGLHALTRVLSDLVSLYVFFEGDRHRHDRASDEHPEDRQEAHDCLQTFPSQDILRVSISTRFYEITIVVSVKTFASNSC